MRALPMPIARHRSRCTDHHHESNAAYVEREMPALWR
jgi:hypothetical protein